MSVGLLYFELDLDTTKFVKKQNDLNAKIKSVANDTDLALQKSYDNLKVTADAVYKLQANLATVSYERIAKAANQSYAEQTRAAQAYIAEINKTFSQLANSQSFSALGIRSAEMIATEKANMMRWYEQAKTEAAGSASELVRIEAAKDAKIIALDNELNAVKLANDAKELASAIATSEKIRAQGLMELEAATMMAKSKRDIQEKWASDEMAVRGRLRTEQEKQAAGYMSEMEWQKKMEATKTEAWAENAKRTREQGLMQIQATKDDVERTKKATADKIAATNEHYNTLGMKSAASINEQIANVTKAATAQQLIVGKNSEDWIRIERAKNEKLKELNKEMVGSHDYSLAAMQRAVLRFYATMYVISTAVDYLSMPFKKGFEAVETYNQSVAALAAMVVTFSQAKPGQDMADQWKEALTYSTAMVPILERIAARTLLSGQETTALANAFARSGVFLQANNSAQIEGFTRISNALPLMTKGQEILRQINTEIRSVMTGQNEQSSMMLQTLKALPGFSKENLEIWRQQGTVLENVGKLLEGFGPATALLEQQWQAVKSTLDTTVTQILRGGMLAAYGEIILSAKDLDKYLNENKDSLIDGMSRWVGNFLLTMYTIKAEVLRLAMLLDKMGGTMTSAKMLLYGPGAALGVESSKKRFGAAAESNIEYESRYKENEKELEQLAIRYNKLADSISVAGLAAAKLARDGESANQKFKAKPHVDEAALKKAEGIQKQVTEIIRKNQLERDQIGKDAYDRELLRIESEAVKYKEAGWSKSQVEKFRTEEQKTAIDKWEEDYKKSNIRATEEYQKQMDATEKSIQQGAKETAAGVEKILNERATLERKIYTDLRKDKESYYESEMELIKRGADEFRKNGINKDLITEWVASQTNIALQKTLANTANFYSEIQGYEDQYRKAKFAGIDKEAEMKAKANKDEVAAAKWAADEKIKFDRDVFDKKSRQIEQGLGDMSSMFNSLSGMYDKNSDEYAQMQEAAQAMIVLQKAVAVVNAVSAVAAAATAPFPAGFVAMASMAAAMGNLLGSIGVTFGGGSVASAPSAAYGQNTTVLGGANNQGSESIANSYKLLEDTYKMEDTKLTGIYNQMKNLNQNITGLVNNILRTGGDFTGTSLKTAGFAENNFAKITPNYWMNELSGGFYNKITFGISGAVDNFLGKIGNKIFGGSSETSLTASGISVGAGSLGDLINGTKLLVQSFADLRKETDGGWFHSDRTEIWTEYKTLDESISNMMTNVFKSMGTTMLELNKSLGTNANEAAIKAYQFDIGKIDLKGLDGEAISKKISEAISNVGDKMASDLFGSIVGTYQKINEGLLETAIRLVINKEVVLDTLAMTGQAFVGSTADIIAFSESIINMAGDLDALRTAAETYYDKFFTDAEKQARLQDQLIKGMSGVNQILPAARDGYRGLLESLDLNTDAGKEAYITMLKLAKSADEYYTALEDVAKKQDEVVASLRKQSQTITQWLSDLNRSPLAPSNSMEAVSTEYNRLKRLAKGTGATEADTSSYLNYAKEYLDYMRKYGGDYKALYASVVSDVQGLQSTIDTKVSDAQLAAATALSSAAALLGSAGNALINAATAQAIISAGGQATGYYSPKVGWTGGAQLYTTPGQTLQDAINNAIQMGYTQENPWAGGFAATATAEEVIANTTTNQDKWDFSDWSDSQTLINAGLGGYAEGGYHDGGWRMVGERGPELEFTPPSRIFNNKQTMNMLDNLGLNGGSNGPGREEIHIHIHNETDGREVSEIIAKYIPRNGNLSAAIKKAAA